MKLVLFRKYFVKTSLEIYNDNKKDLIIDTNSDVYKGYIKGIEVIKVAEMISPSLKKKCVAAKLNDVLVDLDTKVNSDASIMFVTQDSPEAFDPRKYLTPARELIKETVKHKIVNVFGSSDKI